ncbi:hypothetical protein C8Q77DRAFT_1068271 [Trametes polyzona]|nr:hypothetical protein C8Q77DRAFT_1068271 [Trametes polyzona]
MSPSTTAIPPTAEALPSLPAELTDRIVDFLHDDWRTLVSCVNTRDQTHPYSPLFPAAEYHLRNSIEILISGTNKELLEFTKCFAHGSHLASLVSSLHLRGPPVHQDELPHALFPTLLELGHLLNLRALSISHLAVELPHRFARFICRLPALEDLSCEGLRPLPNRPGAVRLVADAHASVEEALRFCRQLRRIQIVVSEESVPPDHPADSSGGPYDALLEILQRGPIAGVVPTPREINLQVIDPAMRARWEQALGRDASRLERLKYAVYEVLGMEDSRDGTWDFASRDFLRSSLLAPSLHQLCLRYNPWENTHNTTYRGSLPIEAFLDLLAHLFEVSGSETPQPRFPHLEELKIVLQLPHMVKASLESWIDFVNTLSSQNVPELKRTTIVLESTRSSNRGTHTDPAREMTSDLSRLSLRDSSVWDREDTVKVYAEVVRAAFAQLSNTDLECCVDQVSSSSQ